MALVSRRKIVIFGAIVSILVLFLLAFNGRKKSDNSADISHVGSIIFNVSPETAYPVTIMDETGQNQVATINKNSVITQTTGNHSYVLQAYGYSDQKVDVEVIENATVNKDVSLTLSNNNTVESSAVSSNITSIDGQIITQVRFYDFASWASGLDADGNKVFLKNFGELWSVIYKDTIYDKNSLLSLGVPQDVVDQIEEVGP